MHVFTGTAGAPSANSCTSETDLNKNTHAVGSQSGAAELDSPCDKLLSQATHISSSTSKTMLLAWIHSWSATLRAESEVCQLLLANTSLVLHTKTS